MRKLVRQHPPGAATADHIEERIDDRSPRVTRWSPQLARRGQKRSDQPPLFVGKRTRIGFLFGHSKRSTLRSTIVQVHFLSHLLLFSQLLRFRLLILRSLPTSAVDAHESTVIFLASSACGGVDFLLGRSVAAFAAGADHRLPVFVGSSRPHAMAAERVDGWAGSGAVSGTGDGAAGWAGEDRRSGHAGDRWQWERLW